MGKERKVKVSIHLFMNSAIIVHAHFISSSKDKNHCSLMELNKIIVNLKNLIINHFKCLGSKVWAALKGLAT